jgi:type II secretory pathway component GspD/PulD (secretin)
MTVKVRELLFSLLLLCLGNLTDLAAARPGNSPKPQQQGQAVQETAPVPLIKFQEGLLSVNVRNASWQTVLQEIERHTGIEIRIKGQLSGTLTHEFEGLPLERGLRRLLGHADHVFFYTTRTRQGTTTEILTAIWLFPREESTTREKQLADLSSEPAIERQKTITFPIKTAKSVPKKKAEPEFAQSANADEQEAKLDAELEPEAN